MNELLKINYENERITVSARELHKSLEVEKRFSAWFETNSKGFIEEEDFKGCTFKYAANQYGGTQDVQDYEMTMDMAKHFALMSRTEKGKQARQYLIDVEKDWNSPDKVMARALRIAEQTIGNLRLVTKQQEQIIGELQPKASYYDLILQCKDLISTTLIAKDYGMSANAMNKLLHELGVQYNLSGTWLLYQKHAAKGYTQSKTQNYTKTDGSQGSKLHTYWTQKGRLFIYQLLKENAILPIIERDIAS